MLTHLIKYKFSGGDVLISGIDVPEIGLPLVSAINEPATVSLPKGSYIEESEDTDCGEIHEADKEKANENHSNNSPKTSTRVRPPLIKKRAISAVPLEKTKRKTNHTASIEASQKFIKIARDKYELKKNYYEKKIQILEKQSETLERIAVGVENCAEFLKNKTFIEHYE